MEKKFDIIFDKNIFSLVSIKRALSYYADLFFINIKDDDSSIVVNLESKNDCNVKTISKEIYNKVLEEDVRFDIENETKAIRESMFEKAMKTVNDEK